MLNAIVIGATGATGKALVHTLLADASYSHVTALVRRPHFSAHPKLTETVVNFDAIGQYEPQVVPDVAFSCLGTTLKLAGSKTAQWKVDVDYPFAFAKRMRELGVRSFVLLSAVGAKAGAAFFYSRMKGALEDKIESLQFERFAILRPGSLIRPDSDRAAEKWGVSVMQWLNRVGLFRAYRPLHVATVAKAMAQTGTNAAHEKTILDISDIWALGKENPEN